MTKRKQHPTSDTVECQAVRRKIIKGAAAGLPAVLTLTSGAANALTSAQNCAVAPNNPLTQAAAPLNTDTKGKTTGSGPFDYSCLEITGDNPDPVTGLQTPPSGSPTMASGTYFDTGPGTPLRQRTAFDSKDPKRQEQACVVFVDQQGETLVQDVNGSANGGLPVTASCYTSFTV
jgi:hypothetical protein